MSRHNSILNLGLEIPGDSTVRIASNLEEGEGTHQRSDLQEIKFFPWVNSWKVDALGDLMGLDLGKKGKMIKED